VKHFPGLGRARLDTHRELTEIPPDRAELALDLEPFRRTARRAGAVMISHAADRDGIPSTLSRAAAHRLLRVRLGFRGAAFSDDLEMGALARFGGLPERAARASRAGCDLLFVCSRIEEYPDCVAAVEKDVPERRRHEALARLDVYERRLRRRRPERRARPLPRLIEAIAKLKEGGGRRASVATA
jgi:beta-N-acetylhexosaminidase